ncbi:hypothetical protein, partial [Komagataeibacter europaeus]|uniref:hypothetical protein n=1 Tax=Komagataeibacter europaeus TaxID=33995 RepID=UPI00222E49F9
PEKSVLCRTQRHGMHKTRLFKKSGRKTFSNHKEVLGEAFFKKLRRTPPFWKKGSTKRLYIFHYKQAI